MKSFFSLKGRMRRRDYASLFLGWVVIVAAIGVTEKHFLVNLTPITLIVFAALVPPIVKRLHDLRYSGWFVIGVILIPITGLLLLTVAGERRANQYGPNPKDDSLPASLGG